MPTIPIRFGPADRQIAGLLHVEATPNAMASGVLLCSPFGQEAIRAHRLYKVLAERLARAGHTVLRFDYYATGDSPGIDEEATLRGFVEDTLTAITELRGYIGGGAVSLAGINLGANIVLLASARATPPPRLVALWDPVLDGNDYLCRLKTAHLSAGPSNFGARWEVDEALRSRLLAESDAEALGFPLTETLRKEIADNLASKVTLSANTQIHFFGDARALDTLRSVWRASGASVAAGAIDGTIDWMSDESMSASMVPPEPLQKLLDVLDGRGMPGRA